MSCRRSGEGMIRTVDELRQEQAGLLSAYSQEAAGGESRVAALPRPGGTTAIRVYGRVTAVAAADPTHGPHLLVQRQRWTGTPPELVDTAANQVRCYPEPGATVGAYDVGETVRVVACAGAMIAERIG